MDIFRRIFESTPDALLVVSNEGSIIRANQQAEILFGQPRDSLIGISVEQLIPRRFADGHAARRAGYLSSPRVRPMGAGIELSALRSDGSEFPVDIMLSPMDSEDGRVVLCVVRDVTERRRAEQRIKDSLAEKDVLLKEVHHRVKNNLAVISSLFYLQSARATDPEVIAIFNESRDRVRTMALVHETLYRSGNLSSVNFAEYIAVLCDELERGHRMPGRTIQIVTSAEPIAMNVDTAVPCGLILNELITNALKHAFLDGRSGRIEVTLRRTPRGQTELAVADDGVGPGRALASDAAPLGLRLIALLVRQIDATFDLRAGNPGTVGSVTLPAEGAAS